MQGLLSSAIIHVPRIAILGYVVLRCIIPSLFTYRDVFALGLFLIERESVRLDDSDAWTRAPRRMVAGSRGVTAGTDTLSRAGGTQVLSM